MIGVPRRRFRMPNWISWGRAPPAGRSRARSWPRLARQAGDQVDVQVGVRVLAQPADVVRGLGVVLAPADQGLHLRVEALDADLELQRARRELGDGSFSASGRWSGTSSKWA
jgi:hypothetical protein